MFYYIHPLYSCSLFFFFNDTATTEIYTLSLHDALPIFLNPLDNLVSCLKYLFLHRSNRLQNTLLDDDRVDRYLLGEYSRSEEHTSELQSQSNLVCRLLLEKKKKL